MGIKTLKLDPEKAARSLALRVKHIEQAEDYIRATYPRYAGLKSLEAELEKLSVADRIHDIAKE